jgi:hypothetical protein
MTKESVWVLVEVGSGIPVSIKTFQNKHLAEAKEIDLRKSLNLENDETGLFQLDIEIGEN